MQFFSKLFKRELKESAAGYAIATFAAGQAVWMTRNVEQFAKEGYAKNVIVYRCIQELAKSVASVPWIVTSGDKEIANHPVLKLLMRPNPRQGGASFIEQVVGYLKIAGNSYIEANRGLANKTEPKELWVLMPQRMKVVPNINGLPKAYVHEVNGRKDTFEVDPRTGQSNILHLKEFSPVDDWYGMSPIEAAAFSIDQHNAAAEHNAALLQNGARPSGALVTKADIGKENRALLKQELQDRYQSPKNAGKPLVLGGDIDWIEMSISPKDMDFIEGKAQNARDIALAFGVPPQLLGIPGDNTYANLQEARLALWEQTIIPLLDYLKDELNNWLMPMYAKPAELAYNLDQIPAIAFKRRMLTEDTVRKYQARVITKNEARSEMEYDTVKSGDDFDDGGLSSLFQDKPAAKSLSKKAIKPTDGEFIAAEINHSEVLIKTQGIIKTTMTRLIAEHGKTVIEKIGKRQAFENTFRVSQHVDTHTAELVTQINRTTQKKIKEVIADGVLAGDSAEAISYTLADVFDDMSVARAAIIAQTESTGVIGYATNEAIVQSGLEKKEWITTLDGHARDTHIELDGTEVNADQEFETSSGDSAAYPGGFSSAGENINCRCAVAAVIIDGKAMEDTERKAYWHANEEKRRASEKVLYQAVKAVFALQKNAVINRLNAIAG